MTNVLMCGPMNISGGVSIHMKNISECLSNMGFNIIFYDFSKNDTNNMYIGNFMKLYRRTIGLLTKAIIAHNDYDLIHIQSSGGICSFISTFTGALISKIFNKKLIVTFHYRPSIQFVEKYRFLFSFVLSNSKAFFVVSNKQKKLIENIFPWASNKVAVISNGFDAAKFKIIDKQLCRRTLYLPNDSKILLTIGNLFNVKGHKYLIEAVHQLVYVHRKDIICIIIGSGPLEEEIKEQIKSLNLEYNVLLAGNIAHDKIPIWLNSCDIFVLPSLIEGNPTVMFESIGCGKPFIGTDVGGIPEVIISNKYGLLCEPQNSAKLVENILEALEKKWSAIDIVEYSKQFRWDIVAEKIAIVYQKTNL
ncbi:MAG: glycosyltransferase family 4 protein [Alphaproteobacteria bacterium]|nr:MAG: glycosyltransferase family 4 protein [Alphaproteobacteria bacterium]